MGYRDRCPAGLAPAACRKFVSARYGGRCATKRLLPYAPTPPALYIRDLRSTAPHASPGNSGRGPIQRCTGMRSGEVVRLDRDDVDLRQGVTIFGKSPPRYDRAGRATTPPGGRSIVAIACLLPERTTRPGSTEQRCAGHSRPCRVRPSAGAGGLPWPRAAPQFCRTWFDGIATALMSIGHVSPPGIAHCQYIGISPPRTGPAARRLDDGVMNAIADLARLLTLFFSTHASAKSAPTPSPAIATRSGCSSTANTVLGKPPQDLSLGAPTVTSSIILSTSVGMTPAPAIPAWPQSVPAYVALHHAMRLWLSGSWRYRPSAIPDARSLPQS